MLRSIRAWLFLLGLLCCVPALAAETIAVDDLPPEARTTLHLIEQGGPFPYVRDGVVFHNYEQRLPRHFHDYYHEYTVKTPGVHSRGPRRIVCGREKDCYYTADHYRSFRRITGRY